MKATLTVSVDVSNGDELVATLRVLEQLANPVIEVPGTPPPEGKEAKPKRVRRTKAQIAADDKAKTDAEAAALVGDEEETAAPAPAITEDDLKAAVRARIESHGLDSVKQIFATVGADKLSAIKLDDYAAVRDALVKTEETNP